MDSRRGVRAVYAVAMGGAVGGLAAAISGADERATVLDDKVDAEDHAAWLWMKAHVLKGFPTHRTVIGTELLSPGWVDHTKKFVDAKAAEGYLHHFDRNHASMLALGRIAHELSPGGAVALTGADVVSLVAEKLASGRAWVIELPKHNVKSRFITRTDPRAFAPINPKYGTKVDFTFIASLEGDQWLRGYVPFKSKTGIVAGRSGMTVASGFDLGQWKVKEWQDLGFPPTLMKKITPFAAPNNFKGMSKPQVAAKVGKLGPVPELTKSEADQCDGTVFGKILGDALDLWNASASPEVPTFTALPSGWQTVWLSRNYQEGPNPKTPQAVAFRRAATAGKWQEAIVLLLAYTLYRDRVRQEAALLSKEVPPPITPIIPRPPK